MSIPKIRIETARVNGPGNRVFVDGVQIHGIRRVIFTHVVDEMPTVTLVLLGLDTVIEGEAAVERLADPRLGDETALDEAFRRYAPSKPRSEPEEEESSP